MGKFSIVVGRNTYSSYLFCMSTGHSSFQSSWAILSPSLGSFLICMHWLIKADIMHILWISLCIFLILLTCSNWLGLLSLLIPSHELQCLLAVPVISFLADFFSPSNPGSSLGFLIALICHATLEQFLGFSIFSLHWHIEEHMPVFSFVCFFFKNVLPFGLLWMFTCDLYLVYAFCIFGSKVICSQCCASYYKCVPLLVLSSTTCFK